MDVERGGAERVVEVPKDLQLRTKGEWVQDKEVHCCSVPPVVSSVFSSIISDSVVPSVFSSELSVSVSSSVSIVIVVVVSALVSDVVDAAHLLVSERNGEIIRRQRGSKLWRSVEDD